jgi:amidase
LAHKPAKQNALLVDILLDAGAVIYCKTNVPQTLMALDSDNNLFGRVMNPRNRLVTAGGSSGGEGALIAMRGSLLGIGTDVGGSIRIPAMCNGLYGIKPSAMRVPYVGQESGSVAGSSKIALPASAGPIATSLRDCELLLKVVAEARPWDRDPAVAFGPWEQQGDLESRKPVFGVMWTDDLITPLPPVQKVLEETVQKLRNAGYEVVDMDTPLFKKCQSLANGFFGIDGANFIFDLLEKNEEPLINWLKTRLRRKKGIDIKSLVKLHAQKSELESEMLKIWKTRDGRRIDALICPVAPHPVPPIDRWNGISYTSSFVLLDYPAGTLPIRDFVESDMNGEVKGEPLSSWDKVNQELCEYSRSIAML